MRHFKLMKLGIDTQALMKEIHEVSHLLGLKVSSTQHEVPVVVSLFKPNATVVADGSPWDASASRLNRLVAFIEEFCEEHNLQLANARLLCAPPGGSDATSGIGLEEPVKQYQLVLQSPRGCMVSCGDESIGMRPGELWLCDHGAQRTEASDTSELGLHLVFDAQPRPAVDTWDLPLWQEPAKALAFG